MIKIMVMTLDEGTPRETPWVFVDMGPDDALLLAESLIRQVRTKDPNTRRPEQIAELSIDGAKKRVRFTVCADPDTGDQRG